MSVSMRHRGDNKSPPRSPAKAAIWAWSQGTLPPTVDSRLNPPMGAPPPVQAEPQSVAPPRSPMGNKSGQSSSWVYPPPSPNSCLHAGGHCTPQPPMGHYPPHQAQQQRASISPSRRPPQWQQHGSLASSASTPLLAPVQRPVVANARGTSPMHNQMQEQRPVSPMASVLPPEAMTAWRGNVQKRDGPLCQRCRNVLLADAAYCRMCGLQRQDDRQGNSAAHVMGGSSSSSSCRTRNGSGTSVAVPPNAACRNSGVSRGSREAAVVSPTRRPVTVDVEVASRREDVESRRRVSVEVCKPGLVHVAPLPSSSSKTPQSGDLSLSPLRGSRVRRTGAADSDGSRDQLPPDGQSHALQAAKARCAPSEASYGGAFPGGSLTPSPKSSDAVRQPLADWSKTRVAHIAASQHADVGCDITDGNAHVTACSSRLVAEGPHLCIDAAANCTDGAGKTDATCATLADSTSACSPSASNMSSTTGGGGNADWMFYSDAEMIEFAERTLSGVVAPQLLRRLTRREIVSLVMAQLDLAPANTAVASSMTDSCRGDQTAYGTHSENGLPIAVGKSGEARPGDAAGGGGGAIANSALTETPVAEKLPPIAEPTGLPIPDYAAVEHSSAVVSPPVMLEIDNPWLPQEPFDSTQSELVRALARAESALAMGSTSTSEPPVVAIPPMSTPVNPTTSVADSAVASHKGLPSFERSQINLTQDERTKRLLRNEDTLRQLAEGAHRLLIQAKMEGTQRWDDPALLVRGGRRA